MLTQKSPRNAHSTKPYTHPLKRALYSLTQESPLYPHSKKPDKRSKKPDKRSKKPDKRSKKPDKRSLAIIFSLYIELF